MKYQVEYQTFNQTFSSQNGFYYYGTLSKPALRGNFIALNTYINQAEK